MQSESNNIWVRFGGVVNWSSVFQFGDHGLVQFKLLLQQPSAGSLPMASPLQGDTLPGQQCLHTALPVARPVQGDPPPRTVLTLPSLPDQPSSAFPAPSERSGSLRGKENRLFGPQSSQGPHPVTWVKGRIWSLRRQHHQVEESQ